MIVKTSPVLGHGEQHARERRAGEHRDALDAACDGVRGRQLLRCPRELGVRAACEERNGVVAMVAAIERP